MALNTLSDLQIKSAIRAGVRRKLFDGGGMYLLIDPPKQPGWRLKYRINGREKGMSLGLFADVPLKRARQKRDDARRVIESGGDPSADRKAERQAGAISFKHVAEDWLAQQSKVLAEETLEIYRGRLTTALYPAIGSKSIDDIEASDLLAVLLSIQSRGRQETAHRVRALYGRVARFAIANSKAKRDVSRDLMGKDSGILPVKTTHFAAITQPKRIGDLMRSIDGYEGQPAVAYALKLAPLVFLRPGELRGAEWSEFDLDSDEPLWRVPGERMKMGKAHLVPLATQAVELVQSLLGLTGDGKYLFPSLRTAERPISDGAINAALRRMGYANTEMTGHGFRTMASTRLNELGFPPDVIEKQLAHAEQNAVRDAYNRAERLDERRKMMQAWADHLDKLRTSVKSHAARK